MKKKIIKIILFLIITLITFVYTIKWLNNTEVMLDDSTIELLLEESGSISPKNRIVSTIIKTIKDTEVFNPIDNITKKYSTDNEIENVVKINNSIKNDLPIVYIYNTHQTEKYNSNKEINIRYSVMDASYYLQKKLREYGIESIVEDLSVMDVLNTNNWNYASSYRVSKMFMEKRKQENDSLKYYIDIHRDSVNKNISTITINEIRYAKTMFLLGLENPNYRENEKEIKELEDWLEKKYKGISRGIYEKQGKGVNGVYNQDFSKYCFLIEIGGEENSYEEVENTLDIIAEMFSEYIGGNN